MNSLCRSLALAALVLATQAGTAQDAAPGTILARLREARPDLAYGQPVPSALPGIYEVTVQGGPTLYIAADGQSFVAGDLFSVGPGGFVNVAEQKRQIERRELLGAIRPEDTITFSPANPKVTLTVFTDIDCGFCQKLHMEVPELMNSGIAVRYLAFPRAGIDSESYRKIATAWCAQDPQATLTRLKNREKVPDNVCAGNPVMAQYALGERLGVTGTPALVLPDGTLIPGYRPAAELAQILGVN